MKAEFKVCAVVHNGYLAQQTIQTAMVEILRLKCLRSGITASTEYTSTARWYCLI
ncbi:MAG: hypothetical protein ACTS73_01510 [Arsenophonus sp. NEOnobi-MAG3]